jgi:hypothetical protein
MISRQTRLIDVIDAESGGKISEPDGALGPLRR